MREEEAAENGGGRPVGDDAASMSAPADTARPDERPVNPLAALTLVVVFPKQTFARLKLRPNWIVPILFVMAAVVAKSLLSLGSGILDEALRAEAMRTGVDIEMVRSGAPMAFVASAVVGVPLVILLQSLFFMAVGRLYGGYSSFRTILAAIAYASVPVGLGALAAAALIPVTHSPDLGADLSRFVDPAAHPFLWGAARELGVVPVWFYLLVGIAAGPVLGLGRKKARMVAVTFAAIHILVMSFLGMSEARSQIDPMESWLEVDTGHAVLHFPEGTPPDAVERSRAAAESAIERTREIVGAVPERIDCFFYSSVGEKERLTGNSSLAHGVSWAKAVHVAREGESDVALRREVAKVAGAQVLGKMYNPFIEDGLSFYAGGYWGGRPINEVASELASSGALPRLRELIDAESYDAVEEHAARVAAGSFTAYVIDESGGDSYRELYSYLSRTGAPLPGVLERALGMSLDEIERGWRAFIAEHAPRAEGRST